MEIHTQTIQLACAAGQCTQKRKARGNLEKYSSKGGLVVRGWENLHKRMNFNTLEDAVNGIGVLTRKRLGIRS